VLIDTVSSDDEVKAYIKKIMSQLNKWMLGGKISKLVIVITSKETGEPIERWQFDVVHPMACYMAVLIMEQVQLFNKSSKKSSSRKVPDNENAAPE
jgi:mitotic spindle assembly checkpoint protein MAD2